MFDVDANASVDLFQWIQNLERGGSQDSSLELSDPMVQKRGRVGRFGASAPYCLQGCQMSKYPTEAVFLVLCNPSMNEL